MQRLTLGRTDLAVSELCRGTMTWGTQNTEARAHSQIDLAMEHGVTFWDTAGMSPTNPGKAENVGRTEEIIGSWRAKSGRRGAVVLATRVTGKGQAAVQEGGPITGAVMRAAAEGRLRRLRTDVIDLYRLHWPNRGAFHFRPMWRFDPCGTDPGEVMAHMAEVLETGQALIAEGRIRHVALLNETVWGAARWLHLSDSLGLPRMASVQNGCSLFGRPFDADWAELSVREDMPLLVFLPRATGPLSGKCADDVRRSGVGARPIPRVAGGSRRTSFPQWRPIWRSGGAGWTPDIWPSPFARPAHSRRSRSSGRPRSTRCASISARPDSGGRSMGLPKSRPRTAPGPHHSDSGRKRLARRAGFGPSGT